jgi:hypothetical protein
MITLIRIVRKKHKKIGKKVYVGTYYCETTVIATAFEQTIRVQILLDVVFLHHLISVLTSTAFAC